MKEDPDIVKKLREEEKKGLLNNVTNNDDFKKTNRKKILIVDDDPGVRISVKCGLEEINSNFDIVSVENGRECIKFLKNKKLPDLILLDIMMPVMNGWDTAAEIKKNQEWSEIPIIFLTAKSDFNSKNYGGIISEEYITKPFDKHYLKNVIEKSLKQKK
jgi:CheY-like chemotaxis protein